MSTPSRRLLLFAIVPVIAAAAAWQWRGLLHAQSLEPVVGIVRTTEIHIAPEISGHLAPT
jgi:hypothetical protein